MRLVYVRWVYVRCVCVCEVGVCEGVYVRYMCRRVGAQLQICTY